jgi:hypothetical protein
MQFLCQRSRPLQNIVFNGQCRPHADTLASPSMMSRHHFHIRSRGPVSQTWVSATRRRCCRQVQQKEANHTSESTSEWTCSLASTRASRSPTGTH